MGHPFQLESELFQNQSGCLHGIDLEGNHSESVSLTVDAFELLKEVHSKALFNFTLAVSGRPLLPNEEAFAVMEWGQVDGYSTGCHEEMGILTFRVLLPNGADGRISVCTEFGGVEGCGSPLLSNQNTYFKGLPGCYNGVDFEGSFVEGVFLVVMEIDFSSNGCKLRPQFMISGSIGEAQSPCECGCSSAIRIQQLLFMKLQWAMVMLFPLLELLLL
eukprot:scaffold1511_cov170-Amphora_coffeaeformis.AAC.1